jgi:heptaprenyl diphosphate synthase
MESCGVSIEALQPLSVGAGSETDALEPLWSYAMGNPGKRARASVVHAAAAVAQGSLDGPSDQRIDVAATAVEMFHLGTLVHDDVIDNGYVRRGLPSLPAVYGNPLAGAAAGGLFGAAVRLVSRCGAEAVRIAAEAAARTCLGEMQEVRELHDIGRTPSRYLEATEGKTAGMFWLAAKLGALVGGADATLVDRLARYGLSLGVGFQMADDVLDIAGEERDTGKPRGNDLRNGNYTLPVIYALEEHPALAELLSADAPVDALIDCVRDTVALTRASEDAKRWIEQAADAVRGLPAADGLLTIARTQVDLLAGAHA